MVFVVLMRNSQGAFLHSSPKTPPSIRLSFTNLSRPSIPTMLSLLPIRIGGSGDGEGRKRVTIKEDRPKIQQIANTPGSSKVDSKYSN